MNKQRCKVQSAKSEVQLAKNKERRAKGVKLYAICFVLLALSSMLFAVFAYAQDGLKERIPDLCYRCHTELKDGLSANHVHFPFRQGNCMACHNPHAGSLKGLMKEEINSLCLNCHQGTKKELQTKFVHNAIKKGMCTDCHSAHASKHGKLLNKAEKNLCLTCHEAITGQMNKTYAHLPFKNGECASCHDPHASLHENQILDNPRTLCKKCHAPRCKSGDVPIVFVTEKMDCSSCHAGHASEGEGLLGPYGHPDFLEKRCEKCHNPISPDRKITTRAEGKDLCLSCHKKEPAGTWVKDIHVDEARGGCTLCHEYHASKKKNMTVRESHVCLECHGDTEKRTVLMERALKSIRCVPVKERRCFECHIPPHAPNILYFREDEIKTCARCHEAQHKITHPLGPDVKDPRNGQPITCKTCHGMHSAKADFMLHFDRKRQLCIQCHKK
ncbi:MAG: cytochrome c3 family protein [Nitrospirota bacterium]